MSHYIVYRITNNINGKVYIDTHKTEDINDGYMGSGKYLNHAINKHGIDNFTKEILFVYDNPKDMYEKEAELVNEDFLAEANTYNLRIGGMGGFDYINNNGLNGTLAGVKKREELLSNNPDWTDSFNKKRKEGRENRSEENIKAAAQKRKNTMIERYGTTAVKSFEGKRHTEETKRIQSEKAKARLADPTKNSQFGTMWITNGTKNKKIKKDSALPSGWRRGRVVSKK